MFAIDWEYRDKLINTEDMEAWFSQDADIECKKSPTGLHEIGTVQLLLTSASYKCKFCKKDMSDEILKS